MLAQALALDQHRPGPFPVNTTLQTVFDSWGSFALACGILLVAELVYVLFGFGSGLIAVGGLAIVLSEVKDVVVILLLVSLPAEILVVYSSRRLLRWREVLLICVGIAIGVPIGALVLKSAEPAAALILLGAFLIVTAIGLFMLPAHRQLRWPGYLGPPTGFISGVLAGMFGTGGPPLIVYYQLAGTEKLAFRANLMAIFLLVTCLRLPTYLTLGLITWPRLLSAAAVAPAVFLGAWLGHRLHLQLEESTFRRLVCAALLVIGALLILR